MLWVFILKSTHNIGFYEEISKIISELSSNPHLIYFFCSWPLFYFLCLQVLSVKNWLKKNKKKKFNLQIIKAKESMSLGKNLQFPNNYIF